MRDVAKIANELADEMDKIFALFTGGPNVPFEKPAKDLVRSKSNGSPKSYAGVKANDQQKLLIRQLWFSLPKQKQTIESKREISEKVGVHVAIVATIIRKTPSEDLRNFLSQQELSVLGAKNI
jgi:hypothetical protein